MFMVASSMLNTSGRTPLKHVGMSHGYRSCKAPLHHGFINFAR